VSHVWPTSEGGKPVPLALTGVVAAPLDSVLASAAVIGLDDLEEVC